MLAHYARGCRLVAPCDGIEDGKVFAAPFPHASAIDVAAEFQKPAHPVLLLDALQKERVATAFGEQFVELGIGLEELARIDGLDGWMRFQIEVLQPQALDRTRIGAKARQEKG